MRIAHIEYGFSYPPEGGAQFRVNKVCKILSRNLNIRLFYPSAREVREQPNFNIESFKLEYRAGKKERIFWNELNVLNE